MIRLRLAFDLEAAAHMNVDVRLFARARDLAGADRVQVELPASASVADLRAALGQAVPALRPLVPNLLVALGAHYADDSKAVEPGMEVACFPPVSGG